MNDQRMQASEDQEKGILENKQSPKKKQRPKVVDELTMFQTEIKRSGQLVDNQQEGRWDAQTRPGSTLWVM